MKLKLTIAGQVNSFELQPGWNYLLRSLGAHWWPDAGVLRISNGVAGQQGGGMYFDRLALEDAPLPLVLRKGESLQGREYVIADRLADGTQHYWMPRAPMTRRFGGITILDVPYRYQVLAPTGTPADTLGSPAFLAGVAQATRVRTALRNGTADESVEFMFQSVGPWHPLDIHEGYAHGGRGLEPSPGFEASWSMRVLKADAMAERNTIDLLDRATGEPIANPEGVNLADFADTLKRWGSAWSVATVVNPWYSTFGPRAWNTGVCAYFASLAAFQNIDGEHFDRLIRDAVAGVALWNDPACRMNLEIATLRAIEAWPISRLHATRSIGALGREFGWVAWTVAAAHELGVVRSPAWLAEADAVFVACQSQCGTWQVVASPWPNWSPTPASFTTTDKPGLAQSVPADRSVGQSHEHGILCAGAFAVWRQTKGAALATKIQRAADVWMRPGAPAQRHWLVGRLGLSYTPEVTETWGEFDYVYSLAAASYANRCAQATRPGFVSRVISRLLSRTTPSPDRYLVAMLRQTAAAPAGFVTAMSNPSDTYVAWHVDAVADMQAWISSHPTGAVPK